MQPVGSERSAIVGLVLAGGAAARMGGGDKGLLTVGGMPILDRVVETLGAQCADILISANGDLARFARFGRLVVPDVAPGLGPLAGILAGLDAIAAREPAVRLVATAPTDTPFLPTDLVSRLAAARDRDRAMLACAYSGGRAHHVCALWPVALRDDLRRAVADEGVRQIRAFSARYPCATAEWPCTPCDPFLNVNSPDDLVRAQALAESYARSSSR